MHLIAWVIGFLVKRSQKEYHIVLRTLAVTLGGALFIIVIPALILWAGKLFNTPLMLSAQLSRIGVFVSFLLGLPWMILAVFWQFIHGKGTPVPVVPTKHFLQNGPYRYVRNPMILGFFFYILGWAFLSNHFTAFGAVGLVIVFLLMEIRFIEEPELQERFGNAYREYKKEIPFLLPKLCRKNK